MSRNLLLVATKETKNKDNKVSYVKYKLCKYCQHEHKNFLFCIKIGFFSSNNRIIDYKKWKYVILLYVNATESLKHLASSISYITMKIVPA